MGYLGRTPTPSPIDSSDIPDDSIDASKIIDGAIAVADVADNAITEAKIADAAVVSLKSGRKNLIINGGFDVWQRGTSGFNNSSGDVFTADRWKQWTGTYSKGSATLPTGDIVDTLVSNYTTGSCVARQGLEGGAKVLSGKTVTVSMWIKASVAQTLHMAQFYISSGVYPVGAKEVSVNSTWQKFTHTVTFGDLSAYTNNTLYFYATTGGVASTIEIAQVQLELGSVATDFEHRSYGEELALCQRYYQAYGRASSGTPFRVVGSGNGSNTMLTGFLFQEKMRSAPTIAYYGGGSTSGSWNTYTNGTTTSNSSSTVTADVGDSSVRWNFAGNGSNPGSAYWIDVGISASQFGFTLDAEL